MKLEVVKLDHDFTVKDRPVKELSLRRPKAKDAEHMDKVRKKAGDFTASIELIAALSGFTPDEIRELDAADFQKAIGVAENFSEAPASPEAGAQ